MSNTCSINKYTPIMRIFGIIFLIIILIFTIAYFVYISSFKVKNVENFACYNIEQGKHDVEMRPCTIYFTDNIEKCDSYEELYRMGKTQLERERNKYNRGSKNYNIIQSIINEKEGTGSKDLNGLPCKITLDGWDEKNRIINQFDNNNQPIYPHKSTKKTQNNLLLWGSCFKEINPNEKLTEQYPNIDNNTTKNLCGDDVIKNINDINNPNKHYISLDFASLDETAVYNTLCSSIVMPNNKMNIEDGDKYLKISCYYDGNKLKTNYLSFTIYDKVQNKFNDLSIINATKEYHRLFRFTYDNYKIFISPLRRNVTASIITFDQCGRFSNASDFKCYFSLEDFYIDDKQIASTEGILNLGGRPNNDYVDYKNDIISKISNEVKNTQTKNSSLTSEISNLDNKINIYNNELKILKNRYNNEPEKIYWYVNVANEPYIRQEQHIKRLQAKLGSIPTTKTINTTKPNPDIQQKLDDIKDIESELREITRYNYRTEPDLWRTRYTFPQNVMNGYANSHERFMQIINSQQHTSKESGVEVTAAVENDYGSVFITHITGSITVNSGGNKSINSDYYYIFSIDGDDDCELFINNHRVAHFYGGHPFNYWDHRNKTFNRLMWVPSGTYQIDLRLLEWYGGAGVRSYCHIIKIKDYIEAYNSSTKKPGGVKRFIEKMKVSQPITYGLTYKKSVENSEVSLHYAYHNENGIIYNLKYYDIPYKKIPLREINKHIDGSVMPFTHKEADENPNWINKNNKLIKLRNDLAKIKRDKPTVPHSYVATDTTAKDAAAKEIARQESILNSINPLRREQRSKRNTKKDVLNAQIRDKNSQISSTSITFHNKKEELDKSIYYLERVKNLEHYMSEVPNISEVNDKIKKGITLNNIGNYTNVVSNDNNVYIKADF